MESSKRVRGWTSGRSLPVYNFLSTPGSFVFLEIKEATLWPLIQKMTTAQFAEPSVTVKNNRLI